ncbi:MAG: PLP-dependent aminotransferase family protein [Micromonosporaceae bacterium]|nr:PLP-dependent aminotransferase family protein [Micromonosporaceae bacterium]
MTSQPLISFARGAPSLDIVDVAGLKAAATRALEADPAGATGYGNSYGYPPLREWIAQRHGVQPGQVLVTNGSMQADAFLFEQLVEPGAEVVVEKPTYDRTLLNLRGLGAEVHQVTLEPDGLDVAELRKLLESGLRPRLAHLIPNYQNPAGVTLSLAKRQAVLALAAEYGFTIFEDDPYAEVRFRGEPLPTMLSLDASGSGAAGRVVHASSFTKTICPGVRVGYLVGPTDLIDRIARKATTVYISAGQLAQALVYQFCASGDITRSIATVRTALAQRARLLAEALRTHLPEARFSEPDGGYFLWVELPESVDVDALQPEAAARGVAVVKGSDFLLDGGRHALRLAFSAVTSEQIDPGVRRLAEAVRAVQKTG